jgi:outer membrane protein assembly factor BamB
MSNPLTAAQSTPETASPVAAPPRVLRVWPPVVLAIVYWVTMATLSTLDLPIFAGFFSAVGASLLTGLLFLIWFSTRRALPGRDRILLILAAVAAAVVVGLASDKSVGFQGLVFIGPPLLVTGAAIWLLIARHWSPAVIRNGLLVTLALVWGVFTIVRINGVDGDQKASMSWRWSTSAEDLYLAQRGSSSTPAAPSTGSAATQTLALAPGDWAGFRGENRQGELHGAKIATDWKAAPPKLLWKQRIGPAWSSFVVLGNRLVTQEQRGDEEAVVCLDAATGKEMWAHLDKARFSDGQAGAGPRSSPVFADGRIYSVGATGLLNCLDAATGAKVWSRDVMADSGATTPMWGFSNSPLVIGHLVIAYAGGPGEKGLLAYRVGNGELAWSAATGPTCYSSPQPVTVGKQQQVLLLSDAGLLAIDPLSGKVRWSYDTSGRQMWRVAQPRQIGDSSIVFGSEDLGLRRIDLAPGSEGTWVPSVAWTTRALRPAYNDFVYQDGYIYGFDEGFGCCVDARTGERRWKGGRYGHGQMVLLADQKLLFVISEYGKAVLVAARPEKLEELGQFEAISGKTWNHPVIAHGRLYARNSEEIACYELATPKTQTQTAQR